MPIDGDKEKSTSKSTPFINGDQVFSKLSQISLYITVLLIVVGQWRIETRDIRILYSLCMVIASSVGRYGTNLSYAVEKHPNYIPGQLSRWWAHTALLVFGLLGLIA